MTELKKVYFIEIPEVVMKRHAVIARNEEELNQIGLDRIEKFKQIEVNFKIVKPKQIKGEKLKPPVSFTLSKFWQTDWNK